MSVAAIATRWTVPPDSSESLPSESTSVRLSASARPSIWVRASLRVTPRSTLMRLRKSRGVSDGCSSKDWGMKATMPLYALRFVRGFSPSSSIAPSDGRSVVARMRSRVLFPEPFGPSRPVMPSPSSRLSLWSTSCPRKLFVTSRMLRCGIVAPLSKAAGLRWESWTKTRSIAKPAAW